MIRWINLGVGSVAGGFARYFLAGFVQQTAGRQFPYGVLVVNLLGCFLIGIFDTLAEVKLLLSPSARMLLMTGFCGGFTTFSAFMLDTFHLCRDGEMLKAFGNVSLSVGLGFLLFYLGTLVVRAF